MLRFIKFPLAFTLMLAILLSACDTKQSATPAGAPTAGASANAIQISSIYAPESDSYLKDAINVFNQAYANGKNPITGAALGANEKPIYVTGKSGSSGTVMQGIVNALIAPNNSNVERPTIFEPSFSHCLTLPNYQPQPHLLTLANHPTS